MLADQTDTRLYACYRTVLTHLSFLLGVFEGGMRLEVEGQVVHDVGFVGGNESETDMI